MPSLDGMLQKVNMSHQAFLLQKTILSSFSLKSTKESNGWNFSTREVWLPKTVTWKKVPSLYILLFAAKTIQNIAAILLCKFWRSRLIALAQENSPGSSRAQRVDLFLTVKPQFIKRVYHVCLFLGGGSSILHSCFLSLAWYIPKLWNSFVC